MKIPNGAITARIVETCHEILSADFNPFEGVGPDEWALKALEDAFKAEFADAFGADDADTFIFWATNRDEINVVFAALWRVIHNANKAPVPGAQTDLRLVLTAEEVESQLELICLEFDWLLAFYRDPMASVWHLVHREEGTQGAIHAKVALPQFASFMKGCSFTYDENSRQTFSDVLQGILFGGVAF